MPPLLLTILLLTTTPTLSDDAQSLLSFKSSITSDPTNFLQSWPSTSPCSPPWPSLTCDPSGHVISLSLPNLSLSGDLSSLPSSPFPSLALLDLSRNRFSGPLPAWIFTLSALTNLNLSFNSFSQDVPPGFQNLLQLRTLDLSRNGLSGDVGGLLAELRYVEVVDLSWNELGGGIGLGLLGAGNLSGLGDTIRVLDLGFNRIGGGFFSEEAVGVLKSLEELDVSGNSLVGELPGFDSMFGLKVFRAGGNGFSGNVPGGLFGSVLQLGELDLSGNQFQGSISSIDSSTLRYLNLSGNSFSGPLPSDIKTCISVDLSANMFTGDLSIIQSWGSFSQLVTLDLSVNQLTGSLLPDFFTSPTLTSLNLSGNMLNGIIPLPSSQSKDSLSLPSYTHLASLDLSNNILTGPLPSEIGNYQSLQLLNLRNNSLSGELPSELHELGALEYLDLSINHFDGRLPDLPQSGLKFFNVSYNYLSGTIPQSLQGFPSSSFYPGNTLLVSPGGLPGQNNGKGKHHLKSSVQVAFIVGSIGAVVLILFVIIMLYVMRTQVLCGNRFTGNSIRSEFKLGRFDCSNMFCSPKDNPEPNSVSFSDHHLLKRTSRSLSAQKELLGDGVELGYPDSQQTEPSIDVCLSEQPVILDVYSPDRLVGELFFLDNTLFFTAEELSRAPAEVLGRSSHGTSYKAALDPDHVLAVKWLRVGLVKNKKEFAKEAKKIGSIKHPNVIPWRAYYWGPQQQERLIIADYVHGDSLSSYLYESTPRRYSRLSVSQRLRIAIDVAGSLSYLHSEKGLPHGSLKPSNVVLTGPDLAACLTDYGLHRLMTQNGIAEHILNLGALGYRPPELANCAKPLPTFKADVYAFGVILMELLTRRSAGDIISGQSGAVDLTDWVQKCNRGGQGADCFDQDIAGLAEAPKVMDQLLAISLRCILPVNERPNIKIIYEDLCCITI